MISLLPDMMPVLLSDNRNGDCLQDLTDKSRKALHLHANGRSIVPQDIGDCYQNNTEHADVKACSPAWGRLLF